uniref:Kunitz/Bovine pancreatic trypsin inhibitor domain protein n=1 Tax=Heterorhabditis bacteriophora TaxID=37862 RepID=A0A1I7WPV5_HETBA
MYKGMRGNENNFLTNKQCQKVCQKWNNPCPTAVNFAQKKQCSPGGNECSVGQWCHIGVSQDTTICCSGGVFINMFLTQDDCMEICPVYENPCGSGKPLMVANLPKVCKPEERCPSTHFCHIGVEGSHNYCCPKSKCDAGLFTSNIIYFIFFRFFYDKETRRCREFQYQGTKGNANNFLTLEDCELVCPGMIHNSLFYDYFIIIFLFRCLTIHLLYFCGKYSFFSSPRRPCDLPLEVGEGNEKLERWFYDGGIQMCRLFVYKGMKGNSNNFLTKKACRLACKELNPCGHGEPLTDDSGERILCTSGQKANSCSHGYYCHVGASALTTLCCPRRNIDVCDENVNEGTGGEDLPRWFFDKKQNRCAPFTYGGVGGNENNFISRITCQEICPEYRNYCPHGVPLIESGQVTACGIDKGCPEGFICHMSNEFNVSVCCQDPMDFCLSPRDPGPCNDMETRYGYNHLTDTCIEYEYGGCDGTLNNFRSLQRCTEICCKEYKRKH